MAIENKSNKFVQIYPSLLAADFLRLEEELKGIEEEADALHLDIMDGHFVPNISYGPDIVRQLRPSWHKPFDVHLMVSRPEDWIKAFAAAGADLLVFHQEAGPHAHRLISQIHEEGMKAGVALCPGSAPQLIEPLLPWLDLILIMTVNPGFGGQSYISEMEGKIRRVREMIDRSGRPILLEVDGGISKANANRVSAAGAEVLVAGSAVFKAESPSEAIWEIRKKALESLI